MVSARAEINFERARFKAFLNEIASFVSRSSNELLSFSEVAEKLKIRSQWYKGLQTVPLDKIVGSLGRYMDFDRAFLPLQSHTKERWKKIDELYERGVPMPPVKLYKVGDAYFVRDGHHRVSVAKEKGQKFIEAEVIECKVKVPITAELKPEDLPIKEEYIEFLEQTKLDQLRPDQRIEFTIPGNYRTLIEHISVHRYFMGLEQGHEIPWEEAVISWYDDLYLPVVEAIRKQGIIEHFPGRTEADLYIWLITHWHYLKEKYGPEIKIEEAASDFTKRFIKRSG